MANLYVDTGGSDLPYLPIFKSSENIVQEPEDEYSEIETVLPEGAKAGVRPSAASGQFPPQDSHEFTPESRANNFSRRMTPSIKRKTFQPFVKTERLVIALLVLLLLVAVVVLIVLGVRHNRQPQGDANSGESAASQNAKRIEALTESVTSSPEQMHDCPRTVAQDLTFTPRTLTPMETMTSSALDDHDDGTCLTFVPGHDSSGYRQHVTELTFYVNLSPGSQGLEMRGVNLDCGASVTLTTVVERPGHGVIEDDPCVLTDSRQEVDLDSCTYRCLCPETGCHRLQLRHEPPVWPASPWKLCAINDRGVPTGCDGYKDAGYLEDGIYSIRLPNDTIPEAATVFCDMTTDSHPSIVLMRRRDGSVNFTQDWDSYKRGFGCLDGEFWLGNDIIHALTNAARLELSIDIHSFAEESRMITYEQFSIANESESYRLNLGSVVDRTLDDEFSKQDGFPFSTNDRDNDPYGDNCAAVSRGGWWYTNCGPVQLTGLYGRAVPDDQTRIRWRDWLDNGDVYYPISSVDMKLRPRLLRPEDAADCLTYRQAGYADDGVYEVSVGGRLVQVYCDMTTDGGGWTLVLKRQDGSVDFHVYWNDYKNGFGSIDGEFWLGNDYIHEMTPNGPTKELRVDLRSFQGESGFIVFDSFSVGNERTDYRLQIGRKSAGTITTDQYFTSLNTMGFSTRDRDNDDFYCCSCAQLKYAGWWHKRCSGNPLTGLYGDHITDGEARLRWCGWLHVPDCYTGIEYADMKFRVKSN